ncbi:MAG: hypothetical protein FWH51_04360 [Dehalococcoidia bacterium]|nr:hypothetical protein [Dehalococcoidia bacterium]
MALLILRPAFFDDKLYSYPIFGLTLALIGVVITTVVTQVKTIVFYKNSSLIDAQAAQQQSRGKSGQLLLKKQNKRSLAELTEDAFSDMECISADDIEKHKTIAGATYLLFGIAYISAPDSRYVRFHSNQAMVLWIVWCIVPVMAYFPVKILPHESPAIVVIGLFVNAWMLSLLPPMIKGAKNGFSGKVKELPLIGKFRVIKTIHTPKI